MRQKTDFHWKIELAKLHIAVINQPRHVLSCVDNIPTVCAPQPLFSLLRVLGGLQLKHRPLFTGSLHISITITPAFGSAVGLISLCPIQEVRAWSYSNNWNNVRSNEVKSSKCFKNKAERQLLLGTNWPAEPFFSSNSKTKKSRFSSF